ncbi:MAG TPA: PD-(D/E)XK nuclease family protein [Ktedonobacteraceae bacterium]|jgi:hypothetical protein
MSQIQENTINETPARKALEALVVDNPELERLEALLERFNIFEAIGAVRQEVRHSDFLAFLLNPQQNHGLGDAFLKRFLQKVLSSSDGDVPVSPIDLDIWSLDQALVLREWQSIDILMLDEAHRLAVVIENKIDTGEHSNQLQRYWKVVEERYSGWRIVGLYLTPDGEDPSDERYLSVDYGMICQLLEGLAQSRASTLGPDVLTVITHYTQMLRRHIVAESEIAELCRRIYQKHKAALDLIYEHRPDQQAIIRDLLRSLITKTPGLVMDVSLKQYIRFAPQEWDVPTLRAGSGWTTSGRILLLQFNNYPDSLELILYIGPGPQEILTGLLALGDAKHPPFQPSKKAGKLWYQIYSKPFLQKASYENTIEEITQEITKHWERFVQSDLPKIVEAVRAEKWIWEAPNLPTGV